MTPTRRWRVITDYSSVDYRSERAAYDAVNDLAANRAVVAAKVGDRITVRHWEDGDWALYERAVITGTGWEPA